MSRKNRKQTKPTQAKPEDKGVKPVKVVHDPWAAIEKNETVETAHKAFYKPAEEKTKFFQNKKKKTMNDGLSGQYYDFSAVKVRNKRTRKSIEEKKSANALQAEEDNFGGNVFKTIAKRSKYDSTVEDLMPTEESLVDELDLDSDLDDELSEGGDGESEEPVVYDMEAVRRLIKLAAKSKKDVVSEEKADQFILDEAEEMEDEELDEEDLEDEEVEDEEDEEIEDEEVDDEEDDIEMDDEEEDVETDDESEGDEDVDEEEQESELSEQDAESDEEANLGESRECKKIVQKKKTPSKKVIDFDTFPFSNDDSGVTATRAFGWMINVCDVQSFFSQFHQQNAMVVRRNNPAYYGNLFSSERFVELLEKNYVEYGTNINIASYKGGVRTTLNGKGRVYPADINRHIKSGNSVQLVNPQTFDEHIWYLCEIIQELFHCFVGANTYLTPAGSAGFAPHWDEIDAFLLQLEGRKYWKVWAPRSDEEELPRDSSPNLTQESLKGRKPTFEGWVEAGDLLYIPRGFIHQAHTDNEVHSLHVTISTGRKWAFVDMLEKTIPEIIGSFSDSRLKLRRSLPVNLFDIGGSADCEYVQEENYEEKYGIHVDRHLSMLRNFFADKCMHASIDLMAKEFYKTALPPCLTPEEKKYSAVGVSTNLFGAPLEFTLNVQVRFMRRHGQRLLFESEDSYYIVTRMQNSRLYEGRPEVTIDIPAKFADAFNFLTNSYPEWARISELPPSLSKTEKKEFCHLLYSYGLLMAKR
ncbi:unnamed protein product [Auanema sp. JU1783]|nr:unnamed protein product [Auanema sp. JU1783]